MRKFFFIFFLILPFVANAESNRFSIIYFRLNHAAGDGITSMGSHIGEPNQWFAATSMQYALHPLELSTGGTTVKGVVDQYMVQNFHFGYSLTSWLMVESNFPVFYLNEFSDPSLPLVTTTTNKMGFGDLMIQTRVIISDKEKHAVGLGITPYFTFPTGNENYFLADENPMGGFKVIVDANLGEKFEVGFNGGIEAREKISLFDFDAQLRAIFSTYLTVKISKKFAIKTDLITATSSDQFFDNKVNSPTEILAAATYQTGHFEIGIGGGFGLVRGAGSPVFRSMITLTYSPQRP